MRGVNGGKESRGDREVEFVIWWLTSQIAAFLGNHPDFTFDVLRTAHGISWDGTWNTKKMVVIKSLFFWPHACSRVLGWLLNFLELQRSPMTPAHRDTEDFPDVLLDYHITVNSNSPTPSHCIQERIEIPARENRVIDNWPT